jgi:hypothetical protein
LERADHLSELLAFFCVRDGQVETPARAAVRIRCEQNEAGIESPRESLACRRRAERVHA